MNRRTFAWPGVLILGAVLLLATNMVSAQSVSTGTVTGSVMLPDGTPSPGATVSLEGPALVKGRWATVSDANGRFVFLSVPRGTYKVVASLSGFNTAQFEDVVINAGSTVPLTFNMEIAAAEGEIVVTSEAPIVDTRSSTIETTFGQELIDAIPTSRESFYDLTLTAPGMSNVGADGSWLPSPSAYGSAANENIFLVNGVNATNPRGAPWGSLIKVNYDTVQEVQVKSLGSQAEYGSFSGAAIDVMTKSGSNQFHGTVGYYGMVGDAGDNGTTDFGADWLWTGDPDSITTIPIDSNEAAVTFGGPIVKDKLWFYAGYNMRDSEMDPPIRPLNNISESDIYDLKLTSQFADAHRAWLGLHFEDNINRNETWGPFDASMSYQSPSDNTTIQLEYQWVASDSNLFGFKYLGFKTEQNPYINEVFGTPGYINWWKWIGGRAVGTGGDFPYIEAQKSKRDTLQADFTHYADDWAGQHELKFGVQYTTANGDWMGGYFQGYANFAYPYGWGYTREYMNNSWWSCDYTWCVAPDDTIAMYVYKDIRNPWLNVRESNSIGGFVDDQWVISDRVTVNLGLRYDNMTADYGEGKVYEFFDEPSDSNNPVTLRNTQGYDVYDFKTWSPRLGIAWTLTSDGKTVLRSHIGRYYAPLSVEALRRHGPDMGEQFREKWFYYFSWDEADHNGNDSVDPDEVLWMTQQLAGKDPAYLAWSEPQNASWRLEVDPNTTSPYTDQFNLSIQRQLGKDVAIEFSYIYKNTQDFLVLSPYNLETGEYYEFEGRPYTATSGYQTTVWGVVIEDFNGDGTIDDQDADYPGSNTTRGWRTRNVTNFNGQTPDRTYQGFQVVLTKRFSNRWQGNFAINYTDTDGFYPRPVDQNWYIDGPLTMDTPFGSTPNHFQNNMSGPALMTPEWMAKVAGSYTIPVIETDFGFRLRHDTGRPIFEIDQNLGPFYGGDGVYDPATMLVSPGWHERMVAQDPTDPSWMPSTTIIDLNLRKRFGLGKGTGITASLDVLNVSNEGRANAVGYTGADFGQVNSIILPRIYRLGLKFDF
jgi:outer membrane receptor protein involved in Fe transport